MNIPANGERFVMKSYLKTQYGSIENDPLRQTLENAA